MTTNNNKPIIRKVWKVSSTKTKIVTIPADSDIQKGDYVKITKVDLE